MNDNPQPQGELRGNMVMYKSPEPLDRERHKDLGLTPSDTPFGFAGKVSAVPLNVAEFGVGAVNYPIIFAGDDRIPLAVMGLRESENLFIDADGGAEKGVYLPAFIRRYPFVLANDERGERMIVCLDRDAEGLTPTGEVRLFDNGQPTEFTQNALKFCEDFEVERARTQSFVKLLRDLDLLEVRQTLYTPPEPGAQQLAISEYYAVTEERLGALPEDKLIELFKNGALAQIYAHLVSMNCWDQLVARALARGALDVPKLAVQ